MSVSDLDDRIADAAEEVAAVTADGTSVKAHPIKDLIEARKHAAAVAAASKNHLGLSVRKMIPLD